MPVKLLKIGDRIRLKVRTLGGWKGTGTVTALDKSGVWFLKDGDDAKDWIAGRNCAMRHEVALITRKRNAVGVNMATPGEAPQWESVCLD